MPNRYISRYAKHDTHFERTDPFKYATWDEEHESHWLQLVIIGVAFGLCFYGVICIILFLGV